MSKILKTSKPTVQLSTEPRPSRIRREPSTPAPGEKPKSLVARIQWDSAEWEVRLALAGIAFFSIAIVAAIIDIGYILAS